jgi:hypothetical protein
LQSNRRHKKKGSAKIWFAASGLALALSFIGFFWQWQTYQEQELMLSALNSNLSDPIRQNSEDATPVMPKVSSPSVQSSQNIEAKNLNEATNSKDLNSQQINKNELDVKNKLVKETPDENILKTISSMVTDISLTQVDANAIQNIFLQQGISTSKREEGNFETGERIEVEGSAPDRGLNFTRATFLKLASGKEELARLQFSVAGNVQNYNSTIAAIESVVAKKIQSNMTLTKKTENTSRWQMNDSWTVWIKSYSKEDVHPVFQKPLVQVTLEFEVE